MNVSNSVYVLPDSYIITTEFWIEYAGIYIVMGMSSLLLNTIIFFTIRKEKALKTFFYAIIACHSLSQAVYSLSRVINGFYRLLPTYYPEIINVSRIVCHTINFLIYYCPGVQAQIMCFIAFERLYALARPVSYENRSAKQGYLICLGIAMGNLIIKMGPSYLGPVPLSQVITCVTSQDAVTKEWWNYNTYTNFIFVFVELFLQVSLFIFSWITARSLKNGVFANNQNVQLILKRQFRLLKVIRLVIVLHVLTVVPYTVILIISDIFPPRIASRLVVYGGCIYSPCLFFDPILLLLGSTKLRESVRRYFCFCPRNIVHSI